MPTPVVVPAVTTPLVGKALADWLLLTAKEVGFDDAALVDATCGTPDAVHILDSAQKGYAGPLDYLVKNAETRADIQKRMAGCTAVFVGVVNYYHGDHCDYTDEDTYQTGAKISRYAWGSEYHKIVRKKLRKLREGLVEKSQGAVNASIFNDVDAVAERAWAMGAGLGFIGKSSMFIHRQFGTWTFLGGLTIVGDVGVLPKPRLSSAQQTLDCGTCTACLDACPTNAIVAPYQVDARRCLTTWNVECADAPEGQEPHMRGHGFAVGCDICQEVCPWNRFAQTSREPRFAPRTGHAVIPADGTPESVAHLAESIRGTPVARPSIKHLPQLAARAVDGPAALRLYPLGRGRAASRAVQTRRQLLSIAAPFSVDSPMDSPMDSQADSLNPSSES